MSKSTASIVATSVPRTPAAPLIMSAIYEEWGTDGDGNPVMANTATLLWDALRPTEWIAIDGTVEWFSNEGLDDCEPYDDGFIEVEKTKRERISETRAAVAVAQSLGKRLDIPFEMQEVPFGWPIDVDGKVRHSWEQAMGGDAPTISVWRGPQWSDWGRDAASLWASWKSSLADAPEEDGQSVESWFCEGDGAWGDGGSGGVIEFDLADPAERAAFRREIRLIENSREFQCTLNPEVDQGLVLQAIILAEAYDSAKGRQC